MANPLVIRGSPYPFEWFEDRRRIYCRIDLPGCPREEVDVCIVSDGIKIRAKEVISEAPFYEPREYAGTLPFSIFEFKLERTRAFFSNGVLRITVPKR